MNNQLISLGDFVIIAFGTNGSQAARVEGFTKTGKLIIRRYNRSRAAWYRNTTKINIDVVIGDYSGPDISQHLTDSDMKYDRAINDYIHFPSEPLPSLN